jgi:hypothetical protein
MTVLTPKEVVEVLTIFAFEHTEEIWWRMNKDNREELNIYANCSDFFVWGCSDVEEITQEKLPILREVKKEMDSLSISDHEIEYGLLFCAKVRQMRPQGAYYKYLKEETWPLFDACGPIRETGMGNPKPHPTDEPVVTV